MEFRARLCWHLMAGTCALSLLGVGWLLGSVPGGRALPGEIGADDATVNLSSPELRVAPPAPPVAPAPIVREAAVAAPDPAAPAYPSELGVLPPYADGIDEFWSWPGLTRDNTGFETRALYNPWGYQLTDAQRRRVAAALNTEICRVQPLYVDVVNQGLKTAANRVDELGAPLPPGMKSTEQPLPIAPGEFPIIVTTGRGTRLVRLQWGADPDLHRERLKMRSAVEAAVLNVRSAVVAAVQQG